MILKQLKPWHLIVIGILMNIVASVLSHIKLDNVHQMLNEIDSKTLNIDTRIDSLWQRHLEADRNQHLALIVFGQAESNTFEEASIGPSAYQFLSGYIGSISGSDSLPKDLPALVANIVSYQAKLRDQIDELYLERLDMISQREPLQLQSNRTKNIALFLQLMGLILVLSKDLARR